MSGESAKALGLASGERGEGRQWGRRGRQAFLLKGSQEKVDYTRDSWDYPRYNFGGNSEYTTNIQGSASK